MPSRATWLASVPKCDRLRGQFPDSVPCDLPLRWHTLVNPADGVWSCKLHGPMLSGVDAAMRAGFVSVVSVEAEAAR